MTDWRRAMDLRWAVYAVVAAVAGFAFVVSYSHIYDLGREHAQSGTAARLLPLSVDLLIVAASLVLFIQGREGEPGTWLARWMPRLTLYAGIGATVAANVFYGLPRGWLAAVISGWPGAAFVAAVEVGMVTARPAPGGAAGQAAPGTVPAPVPADAESAAALALAATHAAGNPLSQNQLMARFGLTRAAARKLLGALPPDRDRGAAFPEHPGGAPVTPVPAGAPPGATVRAASNGHGGA